ncbi:hypothetical protein CR166_02105 [Ligilactobacillus salivarius]|uniref:SEC10/PgrA surface exclusion domain-containing protein n=1 Tax=Ligilactobacillus salivarius TaxID=1624 RepID=UPI000C14825D|nr:SEC10/PgrA surface exclusion domain-containing protein [Ligilactobacillus salivarius]PHY96262.1 hypothetical protein CR166_02105 [Ligilactobacillus salivarius]
MEKMMKKVAIATTIASAVGVNAVIDNTAKADSVTPTQAKTQTKTDQVQANVDTAKQDLDLASTNVKEAQSKVDSATQANQSANKDVTEKNQVASDAQVALDQAKTEQTIAENKVKDAQKVIESANSETTKTEIADKTNQLNELKQKQTQITNNLSNVQAIQGQKENQNNKAQSELSQAQSTYNQAEKKVNDLRAKLDANNIDNLTNDKTKAEAKVNKIQSELDMANKANKDKAQAVEAATKKVNDATVAAAQAKANLDKSQSELAKAQAALAALENSKTEVLNIIQVPKEYTLKGLKAASEDNNATFEAISKSGIDLNKKFNYSQADVNEKVDYQHLTHEQLVEINKYAISLINQMREHFGLKDLILNEEGLKITKTIADGYQAKRESIMKGDSHDKELLDKRAENIGSSSVYDTVRTNIPAMQVKAAKDVSYREYNSNYISISTMADLKANIYTAILALFFDDARSNYGHALSFLNEHYKYVAVAPSVIDGRVDNYPGYGNAYINFLDWHFVFPGYTTWNDGKYTYYSGNENDKLNPAQDIDLSKATVDTTAAKAELDKKQEAYNAAKTENDKAVAALNTAEAELAKVSKTSDVKTLQSNLAQAKQELKDINNKLANAEQNGTTLKQELQAANKAKDEALKNLQAKQVDVDKANKELLAANAKVNAAQKVVDELNAKVVAVQKELTELNDLVNKGNAAKAELNSLQGKVAAAKENVSEAQKVLDKANEELNLAKVEASQTAQALDKAKTELDQAVAKQQAALDNYNKALNSQKISQEVDRNIQKQTEEKKENKADSGKKSEFTSNKVIKEAKTNVKEANTFKKQHVSVSKASVLPATQLPQTGNKTENQSVWGLVSLAIAGILGLVGYNKQKKNN